MPPHASVCASSIRQRSNGYVSTGSRLAMWPQYSNSSRGARYAARSTRDTGYGPTRLNIGR